MREKKHSHNSFASNKRAADSILSPGFSFETQNQKKPGWRPGSGKEAFCFVL
jgi:hypothetical protein